MPVQVKKSLVLSIYSALAVSTLLVFWQVRNFDFINYDDADYVSGNQHVLNGLTADGIIWAFTTGDAANWHPLTWLSLMLDCQLSLPGDPNPGMIHLVNVFFHLANTLLLFAVLKKMTGSLWPSTFVAAAFALHPMHVQSVAWIAERKDVLSTFFLLLTLAAYAGYVSRPSVFRYIAVLAAFAMGLMAKPMLVTLPFVLLLLDYWPLNRFMPQTVVLSGRQNRKFVPAADKNQTLYHIIIEKVPFFALSVISSVITFLVQQSGGAVKNIDVIFLNDRIANAFLSYAEYMGKMIWPQNLAIFYPLRAAASFPFGKVMMCALLLLGISFFVVRFGRNQRYLPFGWFWFVGTLIPVIGIIQVGSQAYADRYTYIPYIGLFVMIAWGLSQLLSKWPPQKIVFGLSIVIVLTTLGICAHQQVNCWNNSVTLFSHAIKVTQNNYIAYYNLGMAYSKLGRQLEAIDAFKRAIKIKPYYAEAYYNLGFACSNLGRQQEAVEAFRQVVRIKPDYAEAHNTLGLACSKLSHYQEAIEAFRQVVRITPDNAEAHYNIGVAYAMLGRWREAIEAFGQTIRIKPYYAEAHNNLGVAYGKLGRGTEAIDAYKQAVKIKPDYAEAHCNLGYAYLAIGDKNSALTEYNILKTLDTQMANNLFNRINK